MVFPSNEPAHATGPGAIVWRAAAGCSGGAGARVAAVDPTAGGGSPAAGLTGRETALPLQGPLAAGAAPGGRVSVVGRSPGGAGGVATALQGRAEGPFSAIAPAPRFTAPYAATNGYLGDLAVAGGTPAGDLQVQVERFYTSAFVRHAVVEAGPGVRLLTPALDYRSDALLVWEQGGSILTRYLPATGAPGSLQRLAPAGPGLRIAALLSDDRRAIVAWSVQKGGRTHVYMDHSAKGVTFGAPRLLESFSNPHAIAPPPASPTLIRLSTESVVVAWSSLLGGRWVIRSAAVDQDRVGPPTTTSSPTGDALLAALAPGPRADVMLLWTEPRPGAGAAGQNNEQAVYAARGFRDEGSRVDFEASEELAPVARNSEPTVALDPDSDRAVAVWREGQLLRYSLREAAPAR